MQPNHLPPPAPAQDGNANERRSLSDWASDPKIHVVGLALIWLLGLLFILLVISAGIVFIRELSSDLGNFTFDVHRWVDRADLNTRHGLRYLFQILLTAAFLGLLWHFFKRR